MSLTQLVLLILSLSVALNLALSFRILRLLREPPVAQDPLPVTPGELLTPVRGRTLEGSPILLNHQGRASALLFLSSQCPKCREKLPELTALTGLLEPAGLDLWLVSNEGQGRLNRFLADTPLAPLTLRVGVKAYKKLNPSLSSPFYLFVDHEGRLQAGGTVGDPDWQSFLDQMGQIRLELAASA
ncbi:redoxin domain-containing protein [Gallaecimonas kandeliae]|uniref:TlpA family protein disulfide reductase n=1 Tax=Gallaecimonas kandeliae TaxID=3029055 RepID=UPI0026495A65|nr:redoxin domain-containing protein [Gallaecimonas kandeliae]WKE64857.1 redoxin domain-containing protein [Gallaecimonas kandeliae]